MRLIFRKMKDACGIRYHVYVEVKKGVEIACGYFVFDNDVYDHKNLLEELAIDTVIDWDRSAEEEE